MRLMEDKERESVVNRCEYKYLMNVNDALSLQKKLEAFLVPDGHSLESGYMVRSLYFDSLNNIDFYAKTNGLYYGKKVRLRIYHPNDTICKLELKSKNGIFRQKRSVSVSREEALEIINGDLSCLLDRQTQVASLLYEIISMGSYRPVTLVEYTRKALIYEAYNTRITFDSDIRSAEYYSDLFINDPPYFPCMADSVILEVKFNGKLPDIISKVLIGYGLNNISFSKYTTGRFLME